VLEQVSWLDAACDTKCLNNILGKESLFAFRRFGLGMEYCIKVGMIGVKQTLVHCLE
jgi:hypothetical protein